METDPYYGNVRPRQHCFCSSVRYNRRLAAQQYGSDAAILDEVIPGVEGVQAFLPASQGIRNMFRKRLKKVGFRFWIGTRKIMEQVLKMIIHYPNTAVGILLASVIGFLLFSIPLLGYWLFISVEPFLLIAFIIMFGSRDYRKS